MIIIIVAVYILLGVYEFLPLYKQKLFKDIIVNGCMFTISFTLAVMLCFGIHIISPAAPIQKIITNVFGK